MDLSLRLLSVLKMVESCETMIDVGTDHGYIPISLVKDGKCQRAIASDINKGPLEKARKNIKKEDLWDKIQCRLGAGLSVIEPGEVHMCIISGMGGNLIRDILDNHMDVFKSLSYAILQPAQNADILRKYIIESGFDILDESICKEEGKYYETIKIKYNNCSKKSTSIYYEISELMLLKKDPMIYEYINYKISKYNGIVSNLKEHSINSLNRKKELAKKVNSLKELL